MGDLDVLEGVLAKEQALIEGVRPEQLSALTPCPDYDVRALVNHIIGWLQVFEVGANGPQLRRRSRSVRQRRPRQGL